MLDLYAKASQLDQIGFSLTTSKPKRLPLPVVEFEPAVHLRGHAPQSVHVRPENLAWMAISSLDCQFVKITAPVNRFDIPHQQDCQ